TRRPPSSLSARIDWTQSRSCWTISRACARASPGQSRMAMAKRLLDRQASLLDYLSSTAAMFGPQTNAPADPALRALHSGVLRLQARFICNKRMEKIVALFPRTLDIMGVAQRAVLREFVETSRSTQRSSLANAREFHAFLARRWRRSRPRPAYLPDVAACELAMAEVRHVADEHHRTAR